MTTHPATTLVSLSAAMDGSLTAIADVTTALGEAGARHDHRLIGGVAVMLHVQRLSLGIPLRATGDADFGVPPHVLRQPHLTSTIEALGYRRVLGNRWERSIDDRRVAAVDLLVPAYRTRARDNVKVGEVVTTEVPGLAEALRRPPVHIDAVLRLTDGVERHASINLPDAIGMLALKAYARTVRDHPTDVEDLWRCLEIAAVDGVTPEMFDNEEPLERLRSMLATDLSPTGAPVQRLAASRPTSGSIQLPTRLRALLTEVVGVAFDR
jgi:hypothetical protein